MNRPAASRRPTWPVPVLIGVVAVFAIVLIVVSSMSDESSEAAGGVEQGESAPAGDVPSPPEVELGGDGSAVPGGAPNPANPPTTVDRGETPDLAFVERRDGDDPLALGPVDAPVTLVVFSDYQCPYCAKWSNETLPELERYIDAGELRVEWRDVNVFGEASERGARAVYAAALQDEFTAMHQALFADGLARAATELSDERLGTLARDLGLNGDQFDTDYAAESTTVEVARNQQLGLDIGAFTTPAFIFGGQPIVGAQPTDAFITAMDQALAAAQNAG